MRARQRLLSLSKRTRRCLRLSKATPAYLAFSTLRIHSPEQLPLGTARSLPVVPSLLKDARNNQRGLAGSYRTCGCRGLAMWRSLNYGRRWCERRVCHRLLSLSKRPVDDSVASGERCPFGGAQDMLRQAQQTPRRELLSGLQSGRLQSPGSTQSPFVVSRVEP